MSSPHFTLYSHKLGPNGWKVAYVLKALGLTYETKYLDMAKGEHKAPAYTDNINPNGRIPAIVDHKNGDFVLFESNAILQYLVDTYDKNHTISVSDPKEKAQLNQWLFFQGSGQGPYFGQAVHFKGIGAPGRAPELIPYAVTRYTNEVDRVNSVLESVLAKSPSGYLVGGKLTIADLSFIMWTNIGFSFGPEGVDLKAKYPAVAKWQEGLLALPYVKATLADKAAVAPAA